MEVKTSKMTSKSFSKNKAKEGEEQFLRPEGLKRWKGQHFLTDRGVLYQEAVALECEGKKVIEIGAGDGRLTKLILKGKPSELTCVELDKKWIAHLKKKMSGHKVVRVMQMNALELPDDYAVDCVIGNIPYYITSPLLVKLGKWKFERAVLCIQKEVAQRLVAEPGSSTYGRMSIYAQLHFDIDNILQVPRTSFHPQPKVDSSVIILTPKAGARGSPAKEKKDSGASDGSLALRPSKAAGIPANLEAVSAALFSHRLASVANALLHSRRMWGWSKEETRAKAKEVKYAERKVLTISPAEMVDIARALPPMKKSGKTDDEDN